MSYCDFHHTRDIKSTRKVHVCEQCDRPISFGSAARSAAGVFEGNFYTQYLHIECDDAARAFAELNDMWGEDWPWFRQMDDSEFDHHAWLLEHHPIVAARLGLKGVAA